MIRTDEQALLMIEPVGPISASPVCDDLVDRMQEALHVARKGATYRGFHTCVCGAHSGSTDLFVTTVDGHELLTNSLAVHYLMYHRDEVPESEILKVQQLAV